MSRIRRILHPTDFSKASSAAYKRAVEMAKSNRAELLLVHVLTPAIPMMVDGYVSPQVYEDMANATRVVSVVTPPRSAKSTVITDSPGYDWSSNISV